MKRLIAKRRYYLFLFEEFFLCNRRMFLEILRASFSRCRGLRVWRTLKVADKNKNACCLTMNFRKRGSRSTMCACVPDCLTVIQWGSAMKMRACAMGYVQTLVRGKKLGKNVLHGTFYRVTETLGCVSKDKNILRWIERRRGSCERRGRWPGYAGTKTIDWLFGPFRYLPLNRFNKWSMVKGSWWFNIPKLPLWTGMLENCISHYWK